MRCAECDFENADGMAFCGKCGSELKAKVEPPTEVKCPKCGSTMPSTAAFCGICGREFGHASPGPPSISPPPESPPIVAPEDAASLAPTQSLADADPDAAADDDESPPDKQADVEVVDESPDGSLREMAVIPAGWFAMGSSPDVGNDNEHPRHQVELSSYFIDRCAVSNEEYERFNSRHRRLRPDTASGDRDPVVFVSHGDCLNYCRWRAEQEGLPPDTYTLPTEAQWERAARRGTPEGLYPWGDEIDPNWCNTLECGRGRVVPVDEGSPDDLGLFHLGSNVREWCLDLFAVDYYADMAAAGPDPTGPRRRMLVNMNVVRGASFQDKASELGRCAARNYAHPDSSSSDIGFRCVRKNR